MRGHDHSHQTSGKKSEFCYHNTIPAHEINNDQQAQQVSFPSDSYACAPSRTQFPAQRTRNMFLKLLPPTWEARNQHTLNLRPRQLGEKMSELEFKTTAA